MTTTIPREQLWAYIRALKALADSIRDAGPQGIGAGVLYAAMMNVMSLDAFDRTIGLLTSSGLIRKERTNLLVWCAPAHRRD